MSLIKLFADELSVLNNRESLFLNHLPRDFAKTDFATPAHNVGTENLLVFVDGRLKLKDVDYTDEGSELIRFIEPIQPSQTVSIFLIRTGADYSYDNSSIVQFYHGMTDPGSDWGKNDDYYLNINTGELFNHSEGGWISVYTLAATLGGKEVNVTDLANGDILVYSDTEDKFINKKIAAKRTVVFFIYEIDQTGMELSLLVPHQGYAKGFQLFSPVPVPSDVVIKLMQNGVEIGELTLNTGQTRIEGTLPDVVIDNDIFSAHVHTAPIGLKGLNVNMFFESTD